MANSALTRFLGSVVRSSIWIEPSHVRVVWLTMLGLVDDDFVVEASVASLAHASRVSREECADAIRRLTSPDHDSIGSWDADPEGRRAQAVEGGWRLAGVSMSARAEWLRESNTERQRRFRERRAAAKAAAEKGGGS